MVWKIDRLSRSLKHLIAIFEEFQRHDVSIISIQENIDFKGPIGNLIFQIFGAIAQFERELIKGRTHMGKIASAELGNFTGTDIPYGYRPLIEDQKKGKRIELLPEEQKWAEKIYDWYIIEELGEGQIVKRLRELGVPRYKWRKARSTGAWVQDKSVQWTTTHVHTILTNPLYSGYFIANRKDDLGNVLPEDKWTITEVPACVSSITYVQAQEVRKSRVGSSVGDTHYLLSGKVFDMTLA